VAENSVGSSLGSSTPAELPSSAVEVDAAAIAPGPAGGRAPFFLFGAGLTLGLTTAAAASSSASSRAFSAFLAASAAFFASLSRSFAFLPLTPSSHAAASFFSAVAAAASAFFASLSAFFARPVSFFALAPGCFGGVV